MTEALKAFVELEGELTRNSSHKTGLGLIYYRVTFHQYEKILSAIAAIKPMMVASESKAMTQDPRIEAGVKLVPELKDKLAAAVMVGEFSLNHTQVMTVLAALTAAGEMAGERQVQGREDVDGTGRRSGLR